MRYERMLLAMAVLFLLIGLLFYFDPVVSVFSRDYDAHEFAALGPATCLCALSAAAIAFLAWLNK